jgi:toxin secretion/phage lysis holin
MKFLIVLCFIVLDIITGTLTAIKLKTWNSTKMREGGFHKIAIVLFIVLAVLCDFGQQYLDLGFKIPITTLVILYVCFMELGSVIENLGKIYPALKVKLNDVFRKQVMK